MGNLASADIGNIVYYCEVGVRISQGTTRDGFYRVRSEMGGCPEGGRLPPITSVGKSTQYVPRAKVVWCHAANRVVEIDVA